MKRFFLGCAIVMVLLTWQSELYSQNNSQATKNTLRVMSYNIRNAMGMDDVTDFDRLSSVIIRETPDVVALQEIDSVTRRSKGKDVLQEIAGRVNMHALYAPAIDFDGGKYGVGILSKEEPLTHAMFPLPGREEERVLLIAEYKEYLFACTHLSLTEEDRNKSLEIIIGLAEQAGKPFILAGDLNAEPGSSFIVALQKHFSIITDVTKPTFPADMPTVCIDYLAVFKNGEPGWKLIKEYVVEAPIESDHRPVMAEIEWKKSNFNK